LGIDPYVNGYNTVMGFGRINAERALKFLQAPYTLVQSSTTGGTVASTSSSYIITLLGAGNLASGNYSVTRYEIRTTINFPSSVCNVTGVWGRGVGSVGWSQANPNFGEGFCEVVPGTITNNQATLRTYIYDVYTINGQHIGFYPATAQNVVFAYSVLGISTPILSGANIMCTSSVYSVTNLQTGGSVSNWAATPTGIVSLTPNGNSVTLTKASSGNINLTATLTNSGCINNTLTKSIRVGGYSSSDYPISGPSSACRNQNVFLSTNNLPYATNYTWTWPSDWAYVSGQGTYSLSLRTGTTSGAVTVKVASTCDAGGSPAIKFVTINNCGFTLDASPNPTTGDLVVEASDTQLTTNKVSQKIYEIRIIDQYGITKKQYRYSSGVIRAHINLSGFINGIYFIRVFNGTEWRYKQIVVVH